MLKICGYSICVLLDMVFEQPFLTGVFPSEWKTRNIVPIHKNSDKQNIKNYYPVSLPLICGKVFERLIFNEMFNYVYVNKLISLKTSLASNLVIPVLINYYYEIFASFDNGLEVRSAFLDIPKAFDKVWHEGGIFKLKQSGISGEHLYMLSDFLSDRKKGLKIVKIRHGPIFMLEFLKDLF